MFKIVKIAIFVLAINSITIQSQSLTELVNTSDLFLKKQNYDEAIKSATQALDIESNNKGNNTENYAVILGRLGNIYFQLGEMAKSEEYYNLGIKILLNNFGNDNSNYLKQINDLACVFQYRGKYKESEKLLTEAISLKGAKGEKDHSLALSLHNIAKLHQTLSNYELAEKKYIEALNIYEEKMDKESIQYALTSLNYGLLLGDLGNYKKAIEKVKEAIKILENKNLKNDNLLVKSSKLQLALLNLAMSNHDAVNESINDYNDIEKVFTNKSHPDYAPSLYNLALIYWSQSNYDEAKRLLIEALNVSQKQFGKACALYSSCLNSLGLVCWALKEYSTALQYLSDAVDIRKEIYGEDNPKYATSLHNLAGLLSHIGYKDEALNYYRNAIKIYFEQVDKNFPFLSENEKTNYYEFIKERLDLYYCYILQNTDNNPELIGDIYNYQILWKGMLFKDYQKIKQNIILSKNEKLLNTFKQWQETNEAIAKLYSFTKLEIKDMGLIIEEYEQQIINYEKELSQGCKIFETSINKTRTNWKDIQKELRDDEAIVEIVCFNYFKNVWTDTTIYLALILTKETTNHPELVILDEDNVLEKNYLKGYYRGIKEIFLDEGDQELYNVFWGGIENIISGKKTIYLCPDGIYNNINLNTLSDNKGNYVLEKYDLILLSNSSEIIERKKYNQYSATTKVASIFGFPGSDTKNIKKNDNYRTSNSELDELEFSDLPFTKTEILMVDSLLIKNGYETQVFLSDEANEKQFKEIQDIGLLHIATHGIFLSDDKLNGINKIFGIDVERFIDNPLLRSGLLLTGKGNEYVIITAYEVKNMNLDGTALVVLSACETGAGKLLNGEGIYGLERAFRMAGANAVVITLWNVNDKVTQELMIKFYQKWLSGLSVREALKKAQIEIKNEGRHPYFWGAFVVVGE